MRPLLKQRIALYSPQGFLDGANTQALFSIEELEHAKQLNIDMMLVSLKRVIFFNKNGIDTFVQLLQEVRQSLHIAVGFCDYDTNKFRALLKFYDDSLNFSLFKTFEIATLFSPTNSSKKNDILLWHEDAQQRSTMAIELFDLGHNPIIAQSLSEFNEKKRQTKLYTHTVEETHLGLFGQKVASRVSGNAIIYTISNFIDANIAESFSYEYHNNSLFVGFRLFIFDAYKVIAMNVHGINFFTKISTAAAEFNATICIVGLNFDKTPLPFKEELEDAGILFFDTLDQILKDKETLKEVTGIDGTSSTKKRSINKLLVAELPRFIDATVNTIAMMTNKEAIKSSAKVQPLNCEGTEESLASSIGFYGDLDGMLALIFPTVIAKKACELLIGESSDETEEILDALAELVNIIGGRVKSLLQEKQTNVDITLPRTYENIEDIKNILSDNKGVQINLDFEGEQFIFFLTR